MKRIISRSCMVLAAIGSIQKKRSISVIALVIAVCIAAAILLTNSPATQAHSDAPVPMASKTLKTIPVYRIFDAKNGVHFFTSDEDRVVQAQAVGWKTDGKPFYVLPEHTSESKTLTVYIHKFPGVFNIWTYEMPDFNMFGGTHQQAGFWQKDQDFKLGDVLNSQKNGSVPLYKFYRGCTLAGLDAGDYQEGNISGNHVPLDYDTWLIAGENEVKQAEANGFTNKGIIGYVYLAATDVTIQDKIDLSKMKKPDPLVNLVNAHCTPVLGKPSEYTCTTIRGYEICESDIKSGGLNVTGCHTTADIATYKKYEGELEGLACKRLLGIAGEFLCKTKPGVEKCRVYEQSSGGLITKCKSTDPNDKGN